MHRREKIEVFEMTGLRNTSGIKGSGRVRISIIRVGRNLLKWFVNVERMSEE